MCVPLNKNCRVAPLKGDWRVLRGIEYDCNSVPLEYDCRVLWAVCYRAEYVEGNLWAVCYRAECVEINSLSLARPRSHSLPFSVSHPLPPSLPPSLALSYPLPRAHSHAHTHTQNTALCSQKCESSHTLFLIFFCCYLFLFCSQNGASSFLMTPSSWATGCTAARAALPCDFCCLTNALKWSRRVASNRSKCGKISHTSTP